MLSTKHICTTAVKITTSHKTIKPCKITNYDSQGSHEQVVTISVKKSRILAIASNIAPTQTYLVQSFCILNINASTLCETRFIKRENSKGNCIISSISLILYLTIFIIVNEWIIRWICWFSKSKYYFSKKDCLFTL